MKKTIASLSVALTPKPQARKLFSLFGLCLFAAFLTLTFSFPARAETTFLANLDALQQVPANNSNGVGIGIVTLNEAETQISIALKFSGLSGTSANSAQIRHGAAGQNGAPLFNLFFEQFPLGTSNETLTLNFPVTPEQVAQLRRGEWYYSVSSVNFPAGEIRGQILPYSPFVANMRGAQAVPATSSTAAGFATVSLNKAETMAIISFSYAGLNNTSGASVTINEALPGANGAVQFDLFSNQSVLRLLSHNFRSVTPAQVALLKTGRLYFRIANAENPNGEIRGQIKPLNKFADFDGDNRADIAVFRPSNGFWYRLNSSNNEFRAVQWGVANDDTRLVADFDGDGLTDHAVWRQSDATFYVLRSSDGTVRVQQWGQRLPILDKPRPADYDGDGRADFAVFRRGLTANDAAYYYILSSNTGEFRAETLGIGGSSMPGDFDGDRKEDLTVRRNENGLHVYYTRLSSSGETRVQQWGASNQHYAMSGDYDGDGKTDYAAFTFIGENAGNWWILGSASGVSVTKWGDNHDDDFDSADYDGDGKTDFAVYRDDSVFYIRRSTDNSLSAVRFGNAEDRPLTGFPF